MLFAMAQDDNKRTAPFEMKPLPYAREDLAPAISSETLDYHYGKHYRGYVEKLNELVRNTPFQTMTLEEMIRDADGSIFNNAAQVWNHEFYFDTLSPEAQHEPTGEFRDAVDRWFGSFELLKADLTKACMSLFGSGWVWLVEEETGRLAIVSEPNAGNPLRYHMRPLLAIDVWEHAYYIDYRNLRAKAIEQIWPLIDWQVVGARYVARD